MPRQRSTLTRRLIRQPLIPALALALLMAGLLVIGEVFTDVPASAAVSPGVTLRASLADNETEGDAVSGNPSISADGRYVAFDTDFSFDPLDRANDDQGGGGFRDPDSDVYVRDTIANTTTLISHGLVAAGPKLKVIQPGAEAIGTLATRLPGDGDSQTPSISADGRYVAFRTTAKNIPDTDADSDTDSGSRVVVCDRDPDGDRVFGNECFHRLVSRSTDVVEDNPRMSADATTLVYESRAGSGSGARPKLVLVTLNRGVGGIIAEPTPADFTDVRFPPIGKLPPYAEATQVGALAISADGAHVGVTVHYRGTNDTSFAMNVVYEYDVASRDFVEMDVDASGGYLPQRGVTAPDVAMSGDGRRFAYTDPVSRAQPVVRLYDRDPDADGVWFPAPGEPLGTEVVSKNRSGADVSGGQPAFSADGRYLAYVTDALNVHNGVDDSGRTNSCLYSPPPRAYEVPDAVPGGAPAAAPAPSTSTAPSTSAAPPSGAPPSSAPPSTGRSYCDVVVRDLAVDARRAAAGQPRLAAELASPSRLRNCRAYTSGATCEGTGDSSGHPVLSANGSAVAYSSDANDLVSDDRNAVSDVFVRRFTPTMQIDQTNFGVVEIGESATRRVPVKHVGFGPLTPGTVTFGGPNGGEFTVFPNQTCTNTVLHATEQCVVSVRFQPTATGARSGVLQIRPAGGGELVQGRLTGVGKEPPPGFRATPNPLAFGERGVLTPSGPQTVTVTNTGRGPLRLTAVTLIGSPATATPPAGFPADYEITANTCLSAPVPGGGSCQVSVRHVPKAIGVRPAVLQFTEAGTPAVTHEIDLTGAGLAPTIVVKPVLAPPGQVVRVTGSNFPPNSTVGLTLDGAPGRTTVIATNGAFDTAFLILPHTTTGKRPLRATVVEPLPTGLAGPVQASTDFLVVPGSLQPPDFTVRK